MKRLPAKFARLVSGREPVREWLLKLSAEDRKIVGDDIRDAEFSWPIGLPLCRPISSHKGLYEIRSDLTNGRISRVFFAEINGEMLLLHAFVKKSQKAPKKEIDIAVKRMKGALR